MDSNSNLEHNNSNPDSVSEVLKEDDAVIPPIIRGDKIDLIALTKALWNGRKTIYYSIGVIGTW